MLNQFRSFNKDRVLDLDDLIALAAFGRMLRAEYESQKVDEPEFVAQQLRTLRHEIQARVADKQEARRKEIKSQLQRLQTPVERREALQKELDALNTVTA